MQVIGDLESLVAGNAVAVGRLVAAMAEFALVDIEAAADAIIDRRATPRLLAPINSTPSRSK